MDPAWIVDSETGKRYPAIRGGYGADVAVVLTIASLAATAAAAGVSTYAAVEQGKTQREIGKYNQQVAENQAEVARQAAAQREEQHRDQIRRLSARQAAAYGAAGVEIGEGSPLLVMSDTAKQGALDALRIRYGGEAQATGYESQGQLAGYTSQRAAQASYVGAGATLLSGAAQTTGMAYKATRPTTTSLG